VVVFDEGDCGLGTGFFKDVFEKAPGRKEGIAKSEKHPLRCRQQILYVDLNSIYGFFGCGGLSLLL
jgi:hypothetical protein